jgi:hypothetical protein
VESIKKLSHEYTDLFPTTFIEIKGIEVALDQVLGVTWSCLTILGLRQPVEGGAQGEVEIVESRPFLGPFWVYGIM